VPPATIIAVTGLIGAITGILWPTIAVGVLFAFRRPAMRALNRVSDDGGTIEVFGVKVNVGQATEQQQKMIEDLQKQVATLRDAVRVQGEIGPREPTFLNPSTMAPRPPAPVSPPASSATARDDGRSTMDAGLPPPAQAAAQPPLDGRMAAPPATALASKPGLAQSAAPTLRCAAPRLLWVDDHPENNTLIAASLRARGFIITDARDTASALACFAPHAFDAVISDMGRDIPDAGAMLTRQVRTLDGDVPILIFCSDIAARTYGAAARAAGATLVTASTTLLMAQLFALQAGADDHGTR